MPSSSITEVYDKIESATQERNIRSRKPSSEEASSEASFPLKDLDSVEIETPSPPR